MLTREPALAGRREWIGLVLLVAPALLVAMDITALFLALPRLSADLHASSVQQLWITDSYGFAVAGFVITMGTLGTGSAGGGGCCWLAGLPLRRCRSRPPSRRVR
jgi:MFS family permease